MAVSLFRLWSFFSECQNLVPTDISLPSRISLLEPGIINPATSSTAACLGHYITGSEALSYGKRGFMTCMCILAETRCLRGLQENLRSPSSLLRCPRYYSNDRKGILLELSGHTSLQAGHNVKYPSPLLFFLLHLQRTRLHPWEVCDHGKRCNSRSNACV